jgi:exopolyphosphatase/guanosine-5'-triphosphate,3'-diphosphate pyrophosphatase
MVIIGRSQPQRIGRRRLVGVLLLISVSFPAEAATASICVIDMGSNSFRRIVGSFDQGRYRQVHLEQRTLGVGDDLASHGRISDPKLVEIDKTLADFKASCAKEGIGRVVAIGTAAFREAPNRSTVVQKAARLGIPVEIATEKRESELAYLVGSLGQDGYAVIDHGSRSIELVAKDAGPPRYRVFNLGYRLAYERFFAAAKDSSAAILALQNRLRVEAARAPFMKGKKKLVGIEFGEMADVLFEPAPLEGRIFTLQVLQRRLRNISAGTPQEFLTLKQKKDIERALPRLVAAVALIEAFGYSQIELTERELGVGLIIEADLKEAVTQQTSPTSRGR